MITQELGAGLAAASAYALLAWALLEVVLRSWARPERLDSTWIWTRPAPIRSPWFVGPCPPPRRRARWADLVMTPPEPGMVLQVSPAGDPYWRAEELVADPVHIGATEDWSPKHAAAEAEAGMLPLDDVGEWLAERLRSYEHALARIGARRVWLIKGHADQCTLDEALEDFQRGSMALHAYRSMILDSTGSYGPREHMQLEALLAH